MSVGGLAHLQLIGPQTSFNLDDTRGKKSTRPASPFIKTEYENEMKGLLCFLMIKTRYDFRM